MDIVGIASNIHAEVSLEVNFQAIYWCSIASTARDMQGYKERKNSYGRKKIGDKR